MTTTAPIPVPASRHLAFVARAVSTAARGRLKRIVGNVCGNRLLAFEGAQDCLQARIDLRIARQRLSAPTAPAFARH